MQDMNLVRYGRQPINRKTRRFIERFKQRQQETLGRVIRKAIFKHCDTKTAHRAIHGFRRSATDARSGENDFLKTDQPYHPIDRDLHYKRALLVTEKLFRPSRRLQPISLERNRQHKTQFSQSLQRDFSRE